MNAQHESEDRLFDDRIALGLRELDGREQIPDVSDDVVRRLAEPAPPIARRPNRLAVAAALLGVAVTAGVWLAYRDRTPAPVPASVPGDPPQDPVPVRSRADVEALGPKTTAVRGDGIDEADVSALKRLANLRHLELTGMQSVGETTLRALADLSLVETLRIEGSFTAAPAAFAVLGTMPRLTGLTLEDTAGEGQLTDACLSAADLRRVQALRIASSSVDGSFLTGLRNPKLRELSLAHCAKLRRDNLTGLPTTLRSLDLTGTDVRDAAALLTKLAQCDLTCANGLQLALRRGKPPARVLTEVQLTRRTDNGQYGSSAFSFQTRSGDVRVHGNYVDLVWNCDCLHFNACVGMTSRVVDLGETDAAVVQAVPDGPWLTESLKPAAGHTYVHDVQSGEQRMRVVYTVREVGAGTMVLAWAPFDDRQEWSSPANRAAGGTMGLCGGTHGPR